MGTAFSLKLGFVASALFFGTICLPASAQTPLERGKYLGEGIGGCGNCHTPRGGPLQGQELAGGNLFQGETNSYSAYSSNLTSDPETGIGKWTDEQLILAIREGKRNDGSIVGPPMAIDFFKYISDNDVKALVAWLRTIKPVKNQIKKSDYSKVKITAGVPAGNVPDTAMNDPLKYGEYLVRVGHCMECHTRDKDGQPDLANQMGAGGRHFPNPRGLNISANITQDKETGIGSWTDAQIIRAITKGIRPNEAQMRPPMCFACYDKMTPSDLGAIVAYLRTVKPVKNDVYQ